MLETQIPLTQIGKTEIFNSKSITNKFECFNK